MAMEKVLENLEVKWAEIPSNPEVGQNLKKVENRKFTVQHTCQILDFTQIRKVTRIPILSPARKVISNPLV
jgi:hypothetical protein